MTKTNKLKKGSHLGLVKTYGLQPMNYDLYNLEGLTLGKVWHIKRLLEQEVAQGVDIAGLGEEILGKLQNLDEHQTITER